MRNTSGVEGLKKSHEHPGRGGKVQTDKVKDGVSWEIMGGRGVRGIKGEGCIVL